MIREGPAPGVGVRRQAWQALRQSPWRRRARWASVLVRGAPGLEGRPGRRLLGAHDVFVQDDQAAVEELADVHGQPGVRAAAAQLDPAGAEADGVVAGHDALIATAEDEGELAGRPTPNSVRGGRRLAEPAIEIGDE